MPHLTANITTAKRFIVKAQELIYNFESKTVQLRVEKSGHELSQFREGTSTHLLAFLGRGRNPDLPDVSAPRFRLHSDHNVIKTLADIIFDNDTDTTRVSSFGWDGSPFN